MQLPSSDFGRKMVNLMKHLEIVLYFLLACERNVLFILQPITFLGHEHLLPLCCG